MSPTRSEPLSRDDHIRLAYAALSRAAEADPTISGATLFLPSGEMIYLPRPEPVEQAT